MIGRRRPDWGADWGAAGEPPANSQIAAGDAEAAAIAAAAHRLERPVPPVVLTGGDLARTLGITSPAGPNRPTTPTRPNGPTTPGGAQSPTATRVVADLGRVVIDGRKHWFAAHLVARRSWWRGRLLVVANASFVGPWNIAPRAHPGDGRLDVLDANPSLAVRWAARRRLPAGTHVPHPAIAQRRVTEARFDLDPPLDVYLDGRQLNRASQLVVTVEPAALEVWL